MHVSPWTSAAAKDVRALKGAPVSTALESSAEAQQVSFSYNPLLLSSPSPPPSPADDVTHTTLPTPFRSKHRSEVSFLATLSPRPPSPRPPALLLPPPRRLPSPYPPPISPSSNYPRPPSPQASLAPSPSPTTFPPPPQQTQILNNSSRISSPIEMIPPPMQSPSPPLRRPKDPPPSPSPTRSLPSQIKLSPPPPRPSPSPPPPRNDIRSPPPPPPTPCTVCASYIFVRVMNSLSLDVYCPRFLNNLASSMITAAAKAQMLNSFTQSATSCIMADNDVDSVVQVCYTLASEEEGRLLAGSLSYQVSPDLSYVMHMEGDGRCSFSNNGFVISFVIGGAGPDPYMAPSCLQGSFDVQCLGNDGQIASDNCNTDRTATPFSAIRNITKRPLYNFNTVLYCFEIRTHELWSFSVSVLQEPKQE
ncbi:hypothetical protein Vretimale_18262 [Volvox reticuliferus]|uniref:Pherophorin domain-containing protein n=1 Tax=Volvox reticuliferus TaxID=1737510 RepID=A0A8J4GUI9_9CHLO|nr:hypothetical protein Vretimale_18262 [Volvox reticuliferus]